MRKRLFSWLLVLAMVLSMVPTVAFAAETAAAGTNTIYAEEFDGTETPTVGAVTGGTADEGHYSSITTTTKDEKTALAVSSNGNNLQTVLEFGEEFPATNYVVTARVREEATGTIFFNLPGVLVEDPSNEDTGFSEFCLWYETSSAKARTRVRLMEKAGTYNTYSPATSTATESTQADWATVKIIVTATSVSYTVEFDNGETIGTTLPQNVRLKAYQTLTMSFLGAGSTAYVDYITVEKYSNAAKVVFNEDFGAGSVSDNVFTNGDAEITDNKGNTLSLVTEDGASALAVSSDTVTPAVNTGMSPNWSTEFAVGDSYEIEMRLRNNFANASETMNIYLPGVTVNNKAYALWFGSVSASNSHLRIRQRPGNATAGGKTLATTDIQADEWITLKIVVNDTVTVFLNGTEAALATGTEVVKTGTHELIMDVYDSAAVAGTATTYIDYITISTGCSHGSTTTVAGYAATCGEAGLTDATVCSSCGEILSGLEVIPATNQHSYTSEQTKDPTCTEAGETTYTCSVCGGSYTEVVPVDPDAHVWGEGTVTLEPTVDTEGLMSATCTLCGETGEGVTIPKLCVSFETDMDDAAIGGNILKNSGSKGDQVSSISNVDGNNVLLLYAGDASSLSKVQTQYGSNGIVNHTVKFKTYMPATSSGYSMVELVPKLAETEKNLALVFDGTKMYLTDGKNSVTYPLQDAEGNDVSAAKDTWYAV